MLKYQLLRILLVLMGLNLWFLKWKLGLFLCAVAFIVLGFYQPIDKEGFKEEHRSLMKVVD